MVARLLFVLGPCGLAVGLWRGSAGLAGTGALWSVLALACARHSRQVRAEVARRRAARERAGEGPGQAVGMPTFVRGTVLVLAAGVPALVVGAARVGIDDADAVWRWLPLVGGGALTALAVVAALMFLVGAGVLAASGPPATLPAEVEIVTMKQTGTFVNDQPRIEFVLDVRPESRPAYRVTKKATVPLTALGSLGVGRGFRALVAGPDDPARMDIDWDAPLPSEAAADSVPHRLRALERLKAEGLITAEEYDAQRRRVLDSL
jgi:hypothetical protein